MEECFALLLAAITTIKEIRNVLEHTVEKNVKCDHSLD